MQRNERADELERGRRAFRDHAWARAFEGLTAADGPEPLEPPDLERLATSAYLVGRDDDFLRALDRAHHGYRDRGDEAAAARCAFWSALTLLFRGEAGPASGWLARAHRLVDDRDCVERGYLLLPAAERGLSEGHLEEARAVASDAAAVGRRFSDRELVACALHLEGRALVRMGRMEEGLALLDETMVAATSGELSPMVTGLVYCSVIAACKQAYAVGRAREWTSALSRWCEAQPELMAFTATCLVHRAGILRLQGAWSDAVEEAERARRRSEEGRRKPPAAAFYEQAEVLRLQGRLKDAEEAYRETGLQGGDPQPGLALLRLAQGKTGAADAGIRRALAATHDPLRRAGLLAAHVEVLLEQRDPDGAADACRELEETARRFDGGVLRAMARQARGALLLSAGDARAALPTLREGWEAWREAGVPYAAARVRELIGVACRELGDVDGSRLELEAARAAFDDLGAPRDRDRVDDLLGRRPGPTRGLTSRELEVLRHVATGRTNKAVAAQLFLSERTIERHLSNIFAKLGVSSRTAAAAWAYENDLL